MDRRESRHREAALLLHGLPARARKQVLDDLGDAERRLVQPLLDELSALGIPASTTLEPVRAPADARPRSSRERLAERPAQAIVACTGNGSARTLAALLSLSDWPWREDFLALLTDARRREVLDHLWAGPVTVPLGVAEVWCDRLNVEADGTPDALPARRGRFGPRLRSLLRWM
jgi:DNA-binding transcriptional ArsR family regulator